MTDKEKLRKLAEESTPGPWMVPQSGSTYRKVEALNGTRIVDMAQTVAGKERNAYFIAAANPSSVLSILDDLEARTTRIASLEALVRELATVLSMADRIIIWEHTPAIYGFQERIEKVLSHPLVSELIGEKEPNNAD